MSRVSRKDKKRLAKEAKEAKTGLIKGHGPMGDASGANGPAVVDKEKQVEELLHSSFLKTYLENENITDINYDGVKVQLLDNKRGPIRPDIQPTHEEVRRLVNQIANVQGGQINNSNPIMDTEIGYLRVNAVDQSASPDGITFSLRVSRPRLAIADISEMTVGGEQDVSDLLDVLIKARSNIIISGETGTGKTELQKLLVGYIDNDDLIVLIEDTRDSHIKALYPEKNIKSWQTLTGEDRERKFEISDFVKAGLRNFPKWMLVSETRGREAGDMLDSAKTGHSIITTLHATGAIDIPSRLMSMVRQAQAYTQVTDMVIGREITKFLRFGIHLEASTEKTKDGVRVVRRIKEIVEYTGYEPSGPLGNYIYRASSQYDAATNDYKLVEEFGSLSQTTIRELQDKRVYHLLPDRFKPEVTPAYPAHDIIDMVAMAPVAAVQPRTHGAGVVPQIAPAARQQPAVASQQQAPTEPVLTPEQIAAQEAEAKILAMKQRIPKGQSSRRPVSKPQEPSVVDEFLKNKQSLRAERAGATR